MRHAFSPDFNWIRITCLLMLMLSSVSRKILNLDSYLLLSSLTEITSLSIPYNCFHEICLTFSMNQCWFSLLRRLSSSREFIFLYFVRRVFSAFVFISSTNSETFSVHSRNLSCDLSRATDFLSLSFLQLRLKCPHIHDNTSYQFHTYL